MAGNTEIKNLVYNIRSLTAKETAKIIGDLNKKWGDLNTKILESRKRIDNFNSSIVYTIDELKSLDRITDKLGDRLDGIASSGASRALEKIAKNTSLMYGEVKSSNAALATMSGQLHEIAGVAVGTEASMMDVADGIDEVGKHAKKSGGKVDKFGNQLKQTGKRGKGATKEFTGMIGALGGNGLISLYAQFAASLFIVDSAFRGLKESADLVRLEENIAALGNGRNLRGLANELEAVAVGSLSADSALRLAAQSAAFSFDADQIKLFTKQAKQASIALGIDFNDALNRLTKGIAKQEVELLDELGIVTRLEPAMAKYAASIGKTVKQLTDVERKTALATEASLQLEKAYGSINTSSTEYERVSANLATITRQLGKALAEELEPVLGVINSGFKTYIENLGKANTAEGNISAAETAKGLVASANAYKGSVEAIEYYLGKLDEANRAVDANNIRNARTEAQMNAAIAAIKRQAEAQAQLTKAQKAYDKVRGEGEGKNADQVKSLDILQKAYKENESRVTQFSLAAKKALVSYSEELEFAQGMLKLFNETYVEQGKSSKETRDEELKILKSINLAYGTAYTTVQQYTDAVAKASKSATSFASDVQLLEARNWNLKESATTQGKLLLLEARIADERVRGNLAVVKGLKEQKQTAELALITQKREEKKASLNSLYAHYQSLALATSKAQGALESDNLNLQIHFLNRRLEMEDEVLTNLEKQALSREKDLLIQQKQIALATEKTQIGGSAALTGLFGSQDLAANQANKNTGNEEAVMQHGVDGVNSAIESLQSLDSAMGAITGGFMSMGNIIAQSMQNGAFGADAAAASIGAVGQILAGASQQAVSEIDHQIAMEKKRDGQSAKSVAKLKQLEAKKLKEQQKAKLQSAIMSTAAGIASALELPFPYNLVAAGITGAMGLAQVSAIRSQGKNASALASAGSSANQSIEFGSRMNNVDISQQATAGERAYVTGAAGSGTSANNFIGAASGINTSGGTAINVGERGPEVFVPEVPGTIVPSGDAGKGGGKPSITLQMNIDNIDSQSFIDRQDDIMEAVEAAIRAKFGKSLADM